MNFSNICFFSRREWFITQTEISMPILVMEPKLDAFPKFSGRAVFEGSPFLVFNNAQSFKIIDLIIFHTGVRWVAYTGNWSFSCCNKHPFTFFLCLLLATLWQYRNLMPILLIRSIIQDVLTYWTGSSALDIGKSWSPDILVLFCLFISSHNFYLSKFLWYCNIDMYGKISFTTIAGGLAF